MKLYKTVALHTVQNTRLALFLGPNGDARRGWRRKLDLEIRLIVPFHVSVSDRLGVWRWNALDVYLIVGVYLTYLFCCRFGITFLSSADDKSKYKDLPHLGKSLCFGSEEDMYTWLSAIYYSQVNNTINK